MLSLDLGSVPDQMSTYPIVLGVGAALEAGCPLIALIICMISKAEDDCCCCWEDNGGAPGV